MAHESLPRWVHEHACVNVRRGREGVLAPETDTFIVMGSLLVSGGILLAVAAQYRIMILPNCADSLHVPPALEGHVSLLEIDYAVAVLDRRS